MMFKPDETLTSLEYLSEKNYVEQAENLNAVCPNCRGNNLVSTDSITIYNLTIESEIACEDCRCTWIEVFSLTGYYGVEHKP